MKRCPTCQRTFADDYLTYCLDDGSALLNDADDSFGAPPTMRIPEPRVTNQPPPPAAYNQASAPGFKFDSRVLGITGASLLIAGIFMPLLSFLGIISVSYIQVAQMSAAFFTGYLLAAIGVVSLVLALKGRYKPLIGAGIVALVILVIDFFRVRSAIASGLPLQIPGAGGGADTAMMGQAIQSVIQISWGFFALLTGAILLIVAGTKQDKPKAAGPDWNNYPPPPMNYS